MVTSVWSNLVKSIDFNPIRKESRKCNLYMLGEKKDLSHDSVGVHAYRPFALITLNGHANQPTWIRQMATYHVVGWNEVLLTVLP